MTDQTRVAWREWGADAFAAARRADCPVLLSLTATWCGACHEMDAETYADPGIAANVNDGFVPVRVDVDRRPRVRERYNVGGFPSTVFLTPTGEMLTGATYLGPSGFRQVLDRVREMWAERGSDAGRVPRALADDPTPSGEVTPAIESHLAGRLADQYDDEYGGWGTEAKFPLPRTVEFALKRDRERALRALASVRDHLFDDVAGGFFRFAGRRDWSDLHYEKLLDSNAAATRAFVNAYLYTGDDAHLRPVERTVDYLLDALWNGEAFGGSQAPGGGREYYALDAEGRADESAPRTDLTAYAGPNALAADALLAHCACTDESRSREYAERTLAYLADELVSGGVVTRHRADDAPSLVLADQARVAGAFARAAQVLGGDYLDTARSVADVAVERLHDAGSFRDGPAEGVGLLDRPLRPLDGNVEMADALLDLAALTGEARYREVARETVAAFAGAADRLGVQVAGYGSVASRLCRGSLVVAVGGDPGSDLHRAALRIADHERVVVPRADVDSGTAQVHVGDDAYPATTPDELLERVAEAT